MLTALHHVELCVANGRKMVSYFTEKLGFSLRAWRETQSSHQWVVGGRKSTFVVTERKRQEANETFPFVSFCCQVQHHTDSVFNVALEVKNVDLVTEKMRMEGGKLVQPVTEIQDSAGTVRYSIVGSCCGNVVHTLLDKSQYGGSFLPTFNSFESKSNQEELITHIDHITYVCHPGQSPDIINWYEKCLGAQRFLTNRTEDPIEGLVIADGIGMRLRVMNYWRCAESGVCLSNPDLNDGSSLKIVLAESLDKDQENTHIGAFLNGHGGPGLQHIGLHTPDICKTVATFAKNGVLFRQPPAAYYDLEEKIHEIKKCGHDLNVFRQLGILIDPEADVEVDRDGFSHSNRFLLQIFTLPIFGQETFFLEVMERQGARGFGAGNVTALAKSIEQQKRQSSTNFPVIDR